MGKEFYIVAALLAVCILSGCGPSDGDCRELIIVCGDESLATGVCVREARIVLTIPPVVRFTRCDGTKGSITLTGGDCRVSKGEPCE